MTLVAAPPFGALVGACSGTSGGSRSIDGWDVPDGTVLASGQYALLAAVMDALIPGDDASPGATLAQAAWYLDQLLGAFRFDPPRIFAGGPYSGRHGGVDGFSSFQRLSRVEELRWRTMIEGSLGIAEREWNGPVVGLVSRYAVGLAAIDAAARAGHGRSFTALGIDERRTLLSAADPAFVTLAYTHAVEGTYGDPVYGGNVDQVGWAALSYEGDRQPIGYTARQMAHPEEG